MRKIIVSKRAALPLALGAIFAGGAHAADLEGWAMMPATTFAEGPTSGQYTTTNFPATNPLPLVNQQPVQGFSAVLNGPVAGSFYVMPDNGFGTKANSPDALLRMYAITPDFKTVSGGTGTISAAHYTSGAALPSFASGSYINLNDADHKLGFSIIADRDYYPGTSTVPGTPTIAVDPSIKAGRLLTGADLDIESVRKDKNGNLWFGDEFGPFLVKTDAAGKVLRQEIPLAGVQSPDNPYLGSSTPTLGSSRGFEGMAINAAGDKLFTLLEGTVTGDPAKSLRINEFSVDSESYTGNSWKYQLEANGTNIGDMTAINDHQMLVIERNGATVTGGGTPFKKIYLADLNVVDANGFVQKTELVDLMNIADPNDLNGDGSNVFTFPYVTIEDVLVLDAHTLLVINDNNYPGGGGRGNYADNTEFLKIHLDQALDVQAVSLPAGLPLLGSALAAMALGRFRNTRRKI